MVNSQEPLWQCVNDCVAFSSFVTPTYCPHCATTEVRRLDKSITFTNVPDEYEHYENEG